MLIIIIPNRYLVGTQSFLLLALYFFICFFKNIQLWFTKFRDNWWNFVKTTKFYNHSNVRALSRYSNFAQNLRICLTNNLRSSDLCKILEFCPNPLINSQSLWFLLKVHGSHENSWIPQIKTISKEACEIYRAPVSFPQNLLFSTFHDITKWSYHFTSAWTSKLAK